MSGARDSRIASLHDVELAAGFLVSEGVIGAAAEFRSAIHCGGPGTGGELNEYNVLDVALAPGVRAPSPDAARNFYTTSSCGLCGKASIDAVRTVSRFDVREDPVTISPEQIVVLPDRLRAGQAVFAKTGGLHAAGLFDEVVMAVATAHHKKTLFTLDERLELARDTWVHAREEGADRVTAGLAALRAAAQKHAIEREYEREAAEEQAREHTLEAGSLRERLARILDRGLGRRGVAVAQEVGPEHDGDNIRARLGRILGREVEQDQTELQGGASEPSHENRSIQDKLQAVLAREKQVTREEHGHATRVAEEAGRLRIVLGTSGLTVLALIQAEEQVVLVITHSSIVGSHPCTIAAPPARPAPKP